MEELARRYSGLWVGEAIPNEGCPGETPRNAIKWTLSLRTESPENYLALWGTGYDSNWEEQGFRSDGKLFYSLKGKFKRSERTVHFRKIFDQRYVCRDYFVNYEGRLTVEGPNKQAVLRGTWEHVFEGSSGTFVVRLQDI